MASRFPCVPIGSVATVQSGYAFKSSDWTQSGVPVIKIANVKGGRVDLEGCSYVPEEVAETAHRYRLNVGDILISMTGYIGAIGVVRSNAHMLLNQRVGRFTIIDENRLDQAFFLFALQQHDVKMSMQAHAYGVAQPNISPALILEQPIPLPPLATQHKIAAILSAYDDLIENNTRRIAILESMAQMLYREWFVHFRFPGHAAYKMIDSPLGPIPEGWQVVSVPEAVAIDPPTRVPQDGEKPFVPMGCLSNNSMLISNIEYRTGNSGSKFRNGDTLFARITPCLENGKTAHVQFLPSDDAVAFGSTEYIVLRSKTLCPEYVYLLARSNEFRDNAIKSMSGASGRQRVQSSCFDKFHIAHPDSDTLARFHEQVAPLFRFVQMLADKNSNLRCTRDLLLPKLISGEVDVAELTIETAEMEEVPA